MHPYLKNFLWLLVVVAVVVVMVTFNRYQTDEELFGVWKLEWIQTNGAPKRRERELWVFRRGRLTIIRDDPRRDVVLDMSLNLSASPKQIDTDGSCEAGAVPHVGMYEIVEDELRVAQGFSLLPRPREFETSLGDLRTIAVLKRLDASENTSRKMLGEFLVAEFGPPIEYPDRLESDEAAKQFMEEIWSKLGEPPETLSEKEAVVYNVVWMIKEVNNGGFHQFFYNHTGHYATETAGALRTIGAPETALLVEAGCSLFPGGRPAKDYQERRKQLDKFSLDDLETLRTLENRFFSRQEDLHGLLKRFWLAEKTQRSAEKATTD